MPFPRAAVSFSEKKVLVGGKRASERRLSTTIATKRATGLCYTSTGRSLISLPPGPGSAYAATRPITVSRSLPPENDLSWIVLRLKFIERAPFPARKIIRGIPRSLLSLNVRRIARCPRCSSLSITGPGWPRNEFITRTIDARSAAVRLYLLEIPASGGYVGAFRSVGGGSNRVPGPLEKVAL